MKKLCLLVLTVAMSFAALSCSDSDNEALNKLPTGEMTFMVDGIQKSYNNVTVVQKPQSDGSIVLEVTGSQNGDATEYIRFRVRKFNTGANRATRWYYTNDSNSAESEEIEGVDYDVDSNITQNSNNRLRGTFGGTLYNLYSQRIVYITNGQLKYNYNLEPQQ